jgi:hypothetical protein
MIRHVAHLFIDRGRLAFSGYNASGDPRHQPYALVVDVGRGFQLVDDGDLYLSGPGRGQFEVFSPDAFAIAARLGYFGFKVAFDHEAPSRKRDKEAQANRRLGRRERTLSR